jgi:polyphosphate kinase
MRTKSTGTQPRPAKLEQELARPELYINRELAALAFIQRVLAEARSERHKLLDRVRFLSFVGNQLDEFLMVRVAGLKDQLLAQVTEAGPDGLLPGRQLELARARVQEIFAEQRRILQHELLPALAEAGVTILDYDQLTRSQREAAERIFHESIFPVLTPLGADPAHPFPHISSRSLNLAVILLDPDTGERFARLKLPNTLPRFVMVPAGRDRARLNGHGAHARAPSQHQSFVWLEQLIAAHLGQLFPGTEVIAAHPFRVLRDADFEIQSDEAGDLLETVEQGLRQRRFGAVVALIVQPEMPGAVRELLIENLEMDAHDLWELEGPLGLDDVSQLTSLDRPELKAPPLVAYIPPELRRGQDPFSAIRHGDLLLHHPYDAFASVADFIKAAANDPQVLTIKQTLYRVGQNSEIVRSLLEANDHGKQVAVLVELKARFDEENNIEWARRLDRAGVHVVYGEADLKTHAKVALVVRQEASGLVRYVHLGTGNYNAITARGYEDFALLTCRADIGEDATNLFNALTGYAPGVVYHKLLVAPNTLRAGLLTRIEREIESHKASGRGKLIFKVNGLVDPGIIRALYRASQAGVEIDLLVRGMCCLRPGVPGVSDHIRVVSLVGRLLEHSRIYYFANGGLGDDELYLGSADLMPRNLDHRVEVVFPVEDRALRHHLTQVILPAYLRDTANAWRLTADGTYEHLRPPKDEPPFDVQQWLAHTAAPVHRHV